MSAKHTPGPWRVSTAKNYIVKDTEEWPVSIASLDDHHGQPFSNQAANARLIAAAPELLEALRATVAALDASGDGANFDMPSPALDNARALLARLEDTP